MIELTLDPSERAALVRHLANERTRDDLTDSQRLQVDGFLIKLRCQESPTLAHIEAFELLRYVPAEVVSLRGVRCRLFQTLH